MNSCSTELPLSNKELSAFNQVSSVLYHYTERMREDLDFVAAGPLMTDILGQLGRVAAAIDVPVLLPLGESGVGKDGRPA